MTPTTSAFTSHATSSIPALPANRYVSTTQPAQLTPHPGESATKDRELNDRRGEQPAEDSCSQELKDGSSSAASGDADLPQSGGGYPRDCGVGSMQESCNDVLQENGNNSAQHRCLS